MNLAHIIDAHDRPTVALVAGNRETTYGELRDQVARCAAASPACGVGEGDRVALLCGNSRTSSSPTSPSVGLGAIAVPLNPRARRPSSNASSAEVAAVAVIVGPGRGRRRGRSVDRRARAVGRTVVVAGDELPPASDRRLDDAAVGRAGARSSTSSPTTSPC